MTQPGTGEAFLAVPNDPVSRRWIALSVSVAAGPRPLAWPSRAAPRGMAIPSNSFHYPGSRWLVAVLTGSWQFWSASAIDREGLSL